MAGDADFDKVALLLHMDGANGSTTFTDSSATPKTVTAVGDAKISTAQLLFDGASGYFDGNGDALSVANSAALDFGTGDFTIECWVYIAGNSAPDIDGSRGSAIVTPWKSSISGYLFSITGSTTTTGTGLQLDSWGDANGNGSLFRAAASMPQNAWHHVAASVASGVRRLFLNGVQLSGAPITIGAGYTSFDTFGRALQVGKSSHSIYPLPLNGHLRELRITKGVARYTANFPPPTEPFPNAAAAYALSGTVTGSTGSHVARVIRAQREDTGAYVGGAISDATTGAYTITTEHPGEHTVVAYPVTGDGLPALVHHGVTPV